MSIYVSKPQRLYLFLFADFDAALSYLTEPGDYHPMEGLLSLAQCTGGIRGHPHPLYQNLLMLSVGQ